MASQEVQEQSLDIVIYETDPLDRKRSSVTLPHNTIAYMQRELKLTPFSTALPSTVLACLIRSNFLIEEFTDEPMMEIFKQIQAKEEVLDEEFSIVKLSNLIQNANMSANERKVDLADYLKDLETLKETTDLYIQGMQEITDKDLDSGSKE